MSERERDYAYEALAEVCGLDMEADRGRLNAALGEIREREPELGPRSESYLLGDLIHSRAKLYREVMEDAMLTPTALAKHWDALPKEAEARRAARPQVNAPMQTEDVCPDCHGDRIVVVWAKDDGSEETAACPTCNRADGSFWRWDGSRSQVMHPDKVRELMIRD